MHSFLKRVIHQISLRTFSSSTSDANWRNQDPGAFQAKWEMHLVAITGIHWQMGTKKWWVLIGKKKTQEATWSQLLVVFYWFFIFLLAVRASGHLEMVFDSTGAGNLSVLLIPCIFLGAFSFVHKLNLEKILQKQRPALELETVTVTWSSGEDEVKQWLHLYTSKFSNELTAAGVENYAVFRPFRSRIFNVRNFLARLGSTYDI